MILKKQVIEGKESYLPISKDDAKVALKNGEALVFTDEDERDELEDEIDEERETLEDEQERFNEQEEDHAEGENNPHIDMSHFGKDISKMVHDQMKHAFSAMPKGPQGHFHSPRSHAVDPNSKMARLMKVLPFMDEKDLHEFVEELLASDESFEEVDIMAFLPFLSEEDCDLLFIRALKDHNPHIDPMAIAPFVSEKSLSVVVDQYLEGHFQEVHMDGLYPFLSSRDVKRVFKHILSTKK